MISSHSSFDRKFFTSKTRGISSIVSRTRSSAPGIMFLMRHVCPISMPGHSHWPPSYMSIRGSRSATESTRRPWRLKNAHGCRIPGSGLMFSSAVTLVWMAFKELSGRSNETVELRPWR
eukprot:Amastigsp_a510047_133.p4 type:complete len:119 gc:universal Amastigsp_a510047_133:829-473(-)